MSDPYINLAKQTIETFVKEGKVITLPLDLPQEMLNKRLGVFVTLHKKSTGQLRGCVGTFIPTCRYVAAEIIQNAISACSRDPRFPPVTPSELPDLELKVDVLLEPEFTTFDSLDPKKYGLIIKDRHGKAGLLLPDIPQIQTKDQQIKICKQKAFIKEDEPVELFRFTVERHSSAER